MAIERRSLLVHHKAAPGVACERGYCRHRLPNETAPPVIAAGGDACRISVEDE
jgi:hypothetical protein